ncbi:Cytochrome P450 monooxygenase COX1, partial [Psilocybe cubensis]
HQELSRLLCSSWVAPLMAMDILTSPTFIASASLGALAVYYLAGSQKRDSRHPPGPRRLPVIGNAHQMPDKDPWLVFGEWGKRYGTWLSIEA